MLDAPDADAIQQNPVSQDHSEGGRIFDLGYIRNSAEELYELAGLLDASSEDVWLREQATVTKVCSADLRHYRVIAFATHGVTAEEIAGPEPGLALTPSYAWSSESSGFLSASHVAQLRLDADLVILSCCNTAAADHGGLEIQTGIASAFLYAGARSLLVSYGEIDTDVAAMITTGMLRAYRDDPEASWSEALRRAMVMSARNTIHSGHPAYWAPFTIVGA